jgi:hypothetical protein
MEWIELIKENVVVITCFTGVLGYFASSFKDLKREIRLSTAEHRLSSERHEARCDKLYQMFYDLIKDGKK